MMSIYLYAGTPGAGKSAHAANDIRFLLDHKRPVLANFPINDSIVKNPELFSYVPNDELLPARICAWADDYWRSHPDVRRREDWCTVVIDECSILFNSRTWSSRDRLSWVSFMSQHRKYFIKVILIAQSEKMVDSQFRMLIEYVVTHRKVSQAGLAGWLLSAPFLGRLFMQVTRYYQMSEKLEAHWYVLRRKDMLLYDSYARFSGDAGAMSLDLPQDEKAG